MTYDDGTLGGGIRARLTPVRLALAVLGLIGTAILTGVGQPALTWFRDTAAEVRDDWMCGGRVAMAEGDRLSDLAAKEPARAIEHLKTANPFYEKAYGCGFPDAGIRLAVAHCMGLGVPKDALKARQYILEIEGKFEAKRARAKDARQLCGFPH